MSKEFIHTHVHSYYSYLDGMGSPEEKVLKAKELGHKAIAITDHNHLAALPEFSMACKKHGIKMIPGVELYWTWESETISLDKDNRSKKAMELALADGLIFEHPPEMGKNGKLKKPKKMTKKEIAELIEPYAYDTKGYHIIVFAKNQTGLNNLIALQSEAAEVGLFNGRYHCDNELLKKYSEGLIVTTACISSVVSDSFRFDKDDKAKNVLKDWINILGKENVFCEIQGLDWDDQYKVNRKLINTADELGIKVIATNDAHYTNKEDIDAHDTLLCIGIGKLKKDENRMKYSPEFWLKDYDEMIESFERKGGDNEEYMSRVKEALQNTMLIADMVEDNIKIGSDEPLFPKVYVPEGYTEDTYIKHLCWTELYKYLRDNELTDLRRLYEKRLKSELDVIIKKGFSGYMLTVKDAISWGDKNGAPFGPGRGSGAGSLVLFLLGIVKGTDPVKYNLLFSRFLTEDRTSPPDIDSDVSYIGRQNLLNYIQDTYGHDNISQVGTVTKLGVKNGISDVARVLDLPYGETKAITKKLDELMNYAPSFKFKHLDALKDDPKTEDKYNEFKEMENKYKEIFDLARKFEGTPRNTGIHAGGVLITPMPINDIFPTKTVNGRKVTIWDKDVVEQMGGIKFDYLGLKTVSVIDLCLEFIAKNTNTEKITLAELYDTIQIDEPGAFGMICEKRTEAVFQMESDLFKSMISDMQPENINDLIALTSIGRPGPLSAKMDKAYNNRKNGIDPIEYPLPGLEDILGDSYGTIIYQEHVMLIAKKIAGFDDNQADSYLRKALAKGKKDRMELCRQWLIYGKKNEEPPKGYDENNKNQVMYDPQAKHGREILGAINNGYSEEELKGFWEMLKDYASYLFNKSHATSYSLLTLITAYLKHYYPVEFWAALLTIQDDKDKKAKYLELLEKEGIEIMLPDINTSKDYFEPIPEENKILYSLSSIDGIGEASVQPIIENRPYNTLEEIMEKLPKKVINKTAGVALIKCGALDKLYKDENRYELLNKFHDMRKDKDDRYEEIEYDKLVCMEMEKDTLGCPITYKPWFNSIEANEKVECDATIKSFRETKDRNQRLMCFMTVQSEECVIDCVVFAGPYSKNYDVFYDYINFHKDDEEQNYKIHIKGKKDEKGQVKINGVSRI